ncbi:MAG: hypothetical protein HKN45_06560 [Flavobacteriales bacterium]|nr:hypothetical protein [Flavobacteriales bacterium]NNK80273.1 hypothetical protein [Flavobacteriales bacterium]
MKLLTIISFTLFVSSLSFSQTYSLLEIRVVNSENGETAIVDADAIGGSMSFDRFYRTGCIGKYNLVWSFDRDISTLSPGDRVGISFDCTACQAACGYRWTSGTAGGANNITSLDGYDWVYNGNITIGNSTGSVHAWYPGHEKHSATIQVDEKKDVPYSGFYIIMGPHYVYYIYGKGAVSKEINCHSLFGLGKLAGGLEHGAWNSYGWDWMVETIGYALDHVYASNCLSPTYLESLKKRISGASDTKAFYEEIRSYSLSLDTEVETSCSCCNSCTPE